MVGVSIVIPCKNEDKYISRCIDSLLRQEGACMEREIIVVDNGSTDNTLQVLSKYGSEITLYVRPDLPIAGLRNYGVEMSTKEWLAFVDADVEVDRYWGKNFIGFIEKQAGKVPDVKKIITGSTCMVPENPSWVERVWFEQLILRDASSAKYINSGNMILHRELFNRLGGFDTSYKTGEEERFCEEARKNHNGIIIKHEDIKAVHHGYPKTVAAFFQRMRWHGKGMARYLLQPWKSKPLMLAIYYLFLTMGYVFLLSILHRYVYLTIMYLLLQFVPAFLYAAGRWRGETKNLFLLSFLYFCFGWARATAIFDMVLQREVYQSK